MSPGVPVAGCENLCIGVGIQSYGAAIAPLLILRRKTNSCTHRVRRVVKYSIHNTIPMIVLNLLTTKKLVVFLFCPQQEIEMITKLLTITAIGTALATLPTRGFALNTETACPEGTCTQTSDCGQKGYKCVNGCCVNNTQIESCTPSNCQPSAWSSFSTGYETRTYRQCDLTLSNCLSSIEYRCAVGYYGNPTSGSSGCSRCPSSGGTYGTTASAGSTSITSCYIPSGTSFSDSTGSGRYTGNCYY